jgi:hypothetical protein
MHLPHNRRGFGRTAVHKTPSTAPAILIEQCAWSRVRRASYRTECGYHWTQEDQPTLCPYCGGLVQRST